MLPGSSLLNNRGKVSPSLTPCPQFTTGAGSDPVEGIRELLYLGHKSASSPSSCRPYGRIRTPSVRLEDGVPRSVRLFRWFSGNERQEGSVVTRLESTWVTGLVRDGSTSSSL